MVLVISTTVSLEQTDASTAEITQRIYSQRGPRHELISVFHGLHVRECLRSNLLPQFESHSTVRTKYFRTVLGNNFQLLLVIF